MLFDKKKLDRNDSIVKAFTEKYPEEVSEMLTDIQALGTPKVNTGHPADQFVFDDGICDNFERVLTGKISIQDSMMAWKLAVLEVMLGVMPQ